MNKNFKAGSQGGFTLIELIVVIVILGILAATAMPKFADLGKEARTASLRAAKGSIASASSIVRAQALVKNTMTSVTIEGITLTLSNGYPTLSSAAEITNFAKMAGVSDDYDVDTATANTLKVSPKGATASSCFVSYAAPSGSAVTPTITETTSGC